MAALFLLRLFSRKLLINNNLLTKMINNSHLSEISQLVKQFLSVFTDITVSKPSKALNIVYLIFGYVAASAIFPFGFSSTEQISIIIVVGSIIATFLYYTKPVEVVLYCLFLFLRERKSGWTIFREYKKEPLLSSSEFKTGIFNSRFIAFEKAKITGAVFFAISLIISGRVLNVLEIPNLTYFLGLLSGPLWIVAVWEGYSLWEKIRTIAFFYDFLHEGQVAVDVLNNLRKAIEQKDWLEAKLIISNRFRLGTSLGIGGLCLKCREVKVVGDHCDTCGRRLLAQCINCGNLLNSLSSYPKFCPYCGKSVTAKT